MTADRLAMTVYLIWAGEYSDASVIAVCSTKEKAEAFVEAHNANVSGHTTASGEISLYDEARIEPMAIDEGVPEHTPSKWCAIAHLTQDDVAFFSADDHGVTGATDLFRISKYGSGRSVHCYRESRELAIRSAANYQRSFKAGTLLVDAFEWRSGDR